MAESIIQLVEEFKRLEKKQRILGKLPLAEATKLEQIRVILKQRLGGEGVSDRRIDLRVPASLRVRYHSGETFVHNYINNLSAGGVFISTPNPLPLDTKIKLHLFFEDKGKEIVVDGRVVWENTQKTPLHDITKPGMGVKFTKLSDEAKEVIEDLIHEKLSEQAELKEEQQEKVHTKKEGKKKQ